MLCSSNIIFIYLFLVCQVQYISRYQGSQPRSRGVGAPGLVWQLSAALNNNYALARFNATGCPLPVVSLSKRRFEPNEARKVSASFDTSSSPAKASLALSTGEQVKSMNMGRGEKMTLQ